MTNLGKTLLGLTVIALAVGGPVGKVWAQGTAGATAPSPPASPPVVAPSAAPLPAGTAQVAPQGGNEAPSSDEAAGTTNVTVPEQISPPVAPTTITGENLPPPIFTQAAPAAKKRRRVKPLQTTVGLPSTAPDLGGEADLVSSADEDTVNVKPKKWTYSLRGFLRAPLRVGIGPTSPVLNSVGMMSSHELHSPPHLVGANNNDWNSVGLNPSPTASLYLSVGNALVSGTMIIAAGTFFDSGYKELDQTGGISQAYVTMKFSEAFGSHGGLAWNVGAFSERFGMAGPHQNSSGYYNTYLFGRTHVAGEALTADIDLNEHVELVVEHGIGAKLEVVPWLLNSASAQPYLPDQGPTPQGSNFVHHVHAALLVDDWLRVSGHFLTSWTPNDLSSSTGSLPPNLPSSRMDIVGGEVHTDLPRWGSGYIGYSHLDASRVLSLADGIQVIHASNGLGLTSNYFNPTYRYSPGSAPAVLPGSVGDSGKIDTVMFQYMVRMAPLLDLPATGRDLSLVVFGMFNHVTADRLTGGKQDKFKFGAEAQYAALRFMSAGLRFDRVMPNGGNADVAYSALSPRVIIHTTWMSREYIIIDYTRYFIGSMPQPAPSPIYDPTVYTPDKNLLVVSSVLSF